MILESKESSGLKKSIFTSSAPIGAKAWWLPCQKKQEKTPNLNICPKIKMDIKKGWNYKWAYMQQEGEHIQI